MDQAKGDKLMTLENAKSYMISNPEQRYLGNMIGG